MSRNTCSVHLCWSPLDFAGKQFSCLNRGSPQLIENMVPASRILKLISWWIMMFLTPHMIRCYPFLREARRSLSCLWLWKCPPALSCQCMVNPLCLLFQCSYLTHFWQLWMKGFYHRLTALFCFTYFRSSSFLVKFVLVGLTPRDKGVVITHSPLKRSFPPLWALWLAHISSTVRLRKHEGGFANKLVLKKPLSNFVNVKQRLLFHTVLSAYIPDCIFVMSKSVI